MIKIKPIVSALALAAYGAGAMGQALFRRSDRHGPETGAEHTGRAYFYHGIQRRLPGRVGHPDDRGCLSHDPQFQ